MNILIPHNWLLEHLATEAQPEEIQKLVSLSGPSIERIYEREGESVYDIEVTTNRVDSMSVRGIAREAAIILQQAGIPAELRRPLQVPTIPVATDTKLPLPTIENDPTLCKRILCVVLDAVQHSPTPPEMAKRLKQIEQNVHDAVIDITNYVTHELGHPCHAFDYDKVMALGGVIRVVSAEAGKKFTTLDGVTYTTIGGEVVFENQAGEIIDLPAIKGTANTAIDDSTKRVLFWIESITHEKVRFASMKHAIRTVAAQLNEKQVDPELADTVLAAGVALFQKYCGARIASPVYDDFPGKITPKAIPVTAATVTRYLGVSLERDTIVDILESLGCTVQHTQDNETISILPPSFRPDLEIPADIVEEIARIYGYHELPSVLMDTALPLNRPMGTQFQFEDACKRFLAHIGWQEVYTYSMVSEYLAGASNYPLTEHMRLQNPLTDDRVYLRRSLIPSLVEVLDANPEHPTLCVFEIANVYHPQAGALPQEELHLTLIGQLPYAEVRGALESLFRQFYINGVRVSVRPDTLHQSGEVLIKTSEGWIEVGTVEILTEGRVVFDIKVAAVLPTVKTHPTYTPLPKAAGVHEDLTFTLPQRTALGVLIEKMQGVSSLVQTILLRDQYNQNYTFSILYQDPEKSLSSAEVEPIRSAIVAVVTSEFSGKLVGELS